MSTTSQLITRRLLSMRIGFTGLIGQFIVTREADDRFNLNPHGQQSATFPQAVAACRGEADPLSTDKEQGEW